MKRNEITLKRLVTRIITSAHTRIPISVLVYTMIGRVTVYLMIVVFLNSQTVRHLNVPATRDLFSFHKGRSSVFYAKLGIKECIEAPFLSALIMAVIHSVRKLPKQKIL